APSPRLLVASFEELQASFTQECSKISGLLDGHAKALQALCSSDVERPPTTPPQLTREGTLSPTVRYATPTEAVTEDAEIELCRAVKEPMSPKHAQDGQKATTPFVAWQFDEATANPQLRQGAACEPDDRGDELPGQTCRPDCCDGPPRLWRTSVDTMSSASTGRDSVPAGPPARVFSSLSPPAAGSPPAGRLRPNRPSQMSRYSQKSARYLSPPNGFQRLRTSAFPDAKTLQETAEKVVWQGEYDVAELYHDEGTAQWLARHPVFTGTQIIVVFLNAVWIGFETDYNDKEVLYEADVGFVLMENMFCLFFLWEWLVRLCAFRRKVQCIGDFWFVFDTILLVTMVLETWILFIVSAVSHGGSGSLPTNLLRVVRLARLTRSVRIARFLRSIPELAVIMRGILVVMRTVFLILILLTSLLYVFSILFVQVARDTALNEKGAYRDVPSAMMSLVLSGLIPDMAPATYAFAKEHVLYAALFMVFVFLGFGAWWRIMNMLIGVLVQVVSVVATVEAETNQLTDVKSVLLGNHLDLKEDDTRGGGFRCTRSIFCLGMRPLPPGLASFPLTQKP
ncbi:unnamed protein product, partial [Prorocentrum cordatum]